jgi:hypothetical protein
MTDDRKREPPISYRPPEDLRAEFRARVESSGLSVNAFITQAIFAGIAPRQARRPSIEKQDLARLLAEAAQLRQQLDALPLEGAHQVRLHEEAVATLRDIRTLLMQAMGRAP